MPYFQEIKQGKRPFEFRKNDRNYQLGDEVVHHEFDQVKQEETGRTAYTKIVGILRGPEFGIPDGYCIFTQQNEHQADFFRDFDLLSNSVLPQYEEKLSHKMGGNIVERINYTLRSFESAATDSIFRAKNFIDDVKTQFKALELMMEGLASDSLNHGQKRVIANHIITMIRSSVDRIDGINWEYSNTMFERINFFRSQSPEGNLLRKYRELKENNTHLQSTLKAMNEKLPADQRDELPF